MNPVCWLLALVLTLLPAWSAPLRAQEHAESESAETPAEAPPEGEVLEGEDLSEEVDEALAETEPPAAEPQPLAFDPDLFIFTMIVFGVLLLVLNKFAWRPILEGLAKREQNIADNVAAAERTDEEARQLLEQYDHKLAAAQDQVRAILDEARRDAEKRQQEIVAEARSQAVEEMERKMSEIDQATRDALEKISQTSADMAVGLADKFVKK